MCCWKNSKRQLVGVLVAVVVAFSTDVPAAHAEPLSGPLSGEYHFHGKTLLDPPPGEAQDTHLGLVLEGRAARDLFRRMTAKAEADVCLDDGSVSKTQGGLRCTELAGKAGWRCEFAIQLESVALVADGAC
jgi:hypothetical protein